MLRPDLLDYNRLADTTLEFCLGPCVGSKNMSSPIRSVNCSHFVMLFGSELAFNCMIDGKGLNKCKFCIEVWLARQVTICDRVSACFCSERARSESPAGDVAANGKGTFISLYTCDVMVCLRLEIS